MISHKALQRHIADRAPSAPSPISSLIASEFQRYLHRNWAPMGIAAACYLIGIVLSLLVDPSESVLYQSVELSKERTTFDFIQNNLTVAALLSMGFVTLGFGAGALLIGNGLLVGLATMSTLPASSPGIMVAALGPHGVFEVTGLLIAGSIGFKSAQWCLAIATGRPLPRLGIDCAISALVASILIVIAAPVEAHITPILINWAQ